MIYLDYTAHMPVSKPALDAFLETEVRCLGNANAHHDAGMVANQRMKDAQHQIADLLQVKPEEVIFTSGASESNNTAIQGIVYANRHFGRHIITSPLEHPLHIRRERQHADGKNDADAPSAHRNPL